MVGCLSQSRGLTSVDLGESVRRPTAWTPGRSRDVVTLALGCVTVAYPLTLGVCFPILPKAPKTRRGCVVLVDMRFGAPRGSGLPPGPCCFQKH